MRQIIPKREPELIAREEARHYPGWDKAATTTLDHIIVEGVRIVSRHMKAHEMETMQEWVFFCKSNDLHIHLAELFCDSNDGAIYSATIRNPALGQKIANALNEAALIIKPHGHNGIYVVDMEGKHLAFADCHWDEVIWGPPPENINE